jgi:hypothetical protein
MSIEELQQIETEQKEKGLSDEDIWETKYDKVTIEVPKEKKKLKYKSLQEEIKLLTQHGMVCRRRINRTSGKERDKEWNKKREVGQRTRYHLIAMCLLLNKDYHKMEPKVRFHDDHWYLFVQRYNAVHRIIQEHGTEADCSRWTEEKVKYALSHKRRYEKN